MPAFSKLVRTDIFQHRGVYLLLDGRSVHRRACQCGPQFCWCIHLGQPYDTSQVCQIRRFPGWLVELLRLDLWRRFHIGDYREPDTRHVGSFPPGIRITSLACVYCILYPYLVLLCHRPFRKPRLAHDQQHWLVLDCRRLRDNNHSMRRHAYYDWIGPCDVSGRLERLGQRNWIQQRWLRLFGRHAERSVCCWHS